MTTELAPIAALRALTVSHRDVEASLTDLGWTHCGAGDWAIALRSPSGQYAARISPFDPAFEYQVKLYSSARGNRYLPQCFRHLELEGGGSLLVLEFLHPLEESAAIAFRHRLEQGDKADPDLERALAKITRVHARAQENLRWCGRLDFNPANFMQDDAGQIKLIDPFYMQGKKLYERVLTNPGEVVRLFPAAKRRYMFEIPVLAREATQEEVKNLHDSLASAEAEP